MYWNDIKLITHDLSTGLSCEVPESCFIPEQYGRNLNYNIQALPCVLNHTHWEKLCTWMNRLMYVMHPLIPVLSTARSAVRPANFCLPLITPNIRCTSLVVWSKFRISLFQYMSLLTATDGSVLYNGLMQKVEALKVYTHICEKCGNAKCKLDCLDQITQMLPHTQWNYLQRKKMLHMKRESSE